MQPEEQITIKDILLKLISIKNSVIKNWKTLLLFAVIGAGLGVLFDFKNLSDPTYTASTKFYLETAAPTNQYGGFASMFGADGQQGGGLFTGENLLTLIKSTDFLEKTLLKEVTIDGKQQILANYFHTKNKVPGKVEKEKDTYVPLKHTDKSRYTMEDFNSLGIVTFPAAMATTLAPEEKTSFMVLDVKTFDDTLSKVYSEVFLQTLKEYFIESKTGKIRTNLENQQHIVDSLKYALSGTENTLARIQDQNQQVVFEQGKTEETKLKRKSTILMDSYREQERTLSTLKFQLYQDSPLFKITSPQRFPIEAKKSTLTKSYPKGIIIALFLGIIFIIIRDAVRNILKEEKQ
jgi:hypothetical protein